jgi:REP element-mobilizing transposase RayT
MSNYRRLHLPGHSYFFTHITYQRHPWLCTDLGRQALREAIITVRQKHPYEYPHKNWLLAMMTDVQQATLQCQRS